MGLREKLHPNSFKPKMGGKKKQNKNKHTKKPKLQTNKQKNPTAFYSACKLLTSSSQKNPQRPNVLKRHLLWLQIQMKTRHYFLGKLSEQASYVHLTFSFSLYPFCTKTCPTLSYLSSHDCSWWRDELFHRTTWARSRPDTSADNLQAPLGCFIHNRRKRTEPRLGENRRLKQISFLATQCLQLANASFKFDKNISGHSLSLLTACLGLPANASLFILRPW